MSPTTYHNCYRTLRAPSGCGWDELKLAYRRRVHGCHPDLAPVVAGLDPAGREEEFKRVVKAYRQLAEYRKRNGCLPPADLVVDPASLPLREILRWRRTPRKAPDRPAGRTRTALRLPRFHQAAVVAFVMGVSAAALTGQLRDTSSFARTPITTDEELAVGMDPQDVVDVQGIPNYTKGSVWFYGESGVIFDRGCVVGWENQPPFPLRTLVTTAYLTGGIARSINGDDCRTSPN